MENHTRGNTGLKRASSGGRARHRQLKKSSGGGHDGDITSQDGHTTCKPPPRGTADVYHRHATGRQQGKQIHDSEEAESGRITEDMCKLHKSVNPLTCRPHEILVRLNGTHNRGDAVGPTAGNQCGLPRGFKLVSMQYDSLSAVLVQPQPCIHWGAVVVAQKSLFKILSGIGTSMVRNNPTFCLLSLPNQKI